MLPLNEINPSLVGLGARLRLRRLERNETQRVFAARLGVSIPTLRAMEAGETVVQVGTWLAAFWALGRLGEIEELLGDKRSLFDRAGEERARSHARRRASRTKAAIRW